MKNKKVLIIEDDDLLRGMYETKMKMDGIDFESAQDGEEGLKKIKKEKPAVVILDLMMPKKSGFDVLEEMSQDKFLKSIPVIVLSNLSQESDVELAKKYGASEYCVKSDLLLNSLVEKIHKHLE